MLLMLRWAAEEWWSLNVGTDELGETSDGLFFSC